MTAPGNIECNKEQTMNSELKFDYQLAEPWVSEGELAGLETELHKAHQYLHHRKGPGSEFTGWVDWPEQYERAEFGRVLEIAQGIRENADAFIVIGIGGSYLGARSAIDLLKPAFWNQLLPEDRKCPEIYFAGQGISASYLDSLLRLLDNKQEIYINVISKSGTTLEPALAFRILRRFLEERYGKKEAAKRIIVTTDERQGALRELAANQGFNTFTVPDNIGGRYSVLTSVGLLPLAVAGIDLHQVMDGATKAYLLYSREKYEDNDAYIYAAIRNILYRKGKTMEIFAAYEPSFIQFAEWLKQLFGESEGKEHKGIFPAAVNFTTDLHSLGQYIQEGLRNIFMTTIWVKEPALGLSVPALNDNLDGLEYLAGKTLHSINDQACRGTMLAHLEGGVPNLKLSAREINAYSYGMLVYFFEKACGISGYLLGVNPFNQPGVEAYKKKVFTLLRSL
jgi:glucose-6-phosphate isomerase